MLKYIFVFIILSAFTIQKSNSLHSHLMYCNCFVIQYVFIQMVCTHVRVMSCMMVLFYGSTHPSTYAFAQHNLGTAWAEGSGNVDNILLYLFLTCNDNINIYIGITN